MNGPRTIRLLSFAKRLQQAQTLGELLDVALQETEDCLGYHHVWLAMAEDENARELRLIEVASGRRNLIWEVAPVMQVQGDAFLEELLASELPVVIEDARSDPRTNKQLVEALQNRTLVNVPLRLVDKPLGFFGTGTFGDEGCRAPNAAELDYLVGMAGQLSVAASRIRIQEQRVLDERGRLDLEQRLQQLQKLESLGLLAGGIAHDFNNLLTVILSGASLAQARTHDPLTLAEIHTVLDAATRARDLTRQLLAMSRSQELELKPLDLNAQLSNLLTLARRVLPENVRLELNQAPRLPLVEGDASQLDQVFMNLLINARDAMPDGGKLLVRTAATRIDANALRAYPWAEPGSYVAVTVTDSGVGMSEEVIEHVFEPFFSTKGPRSGTGLGLAVTYGIVRQHGGVIQCQSQLGIGTTFRVHLPALEPAERASASGGTSQGDDDDSARTRGVQRRPARFVS